MNKIILIIMVVLITMVAASLSAYWQECPPCIDPIFCDMVTNLSVFDDIQCDLDDPNKIQATPIEASSVITLSVNEMARLEHLIENWLKPAVVINVRNYSRTMVIPMDNKNQFACVVIASHAFVDDAGFGVAIKSGTYNYISFSKIRDF